MNYDKLLRIYRWDDSGRERDRSTTAYHTGNSLCIFESFFLLSLYVDRHDFSQNAIYFRVYFLHVLQKFIDHVWSSVNHRFELELFRLAYYVITKSRWHVHFVRSVGRMVGRALQGHQKRFEICVDHERHRQHFFDRDELDPPVFIVGQNNLL